MRLLGLFRGRVVDREVLQENLSHSPFPSLLILTLSNIPIIITESQVPLTTFFLFGSSSKSSSNSMPSSEAESHAEGADSDRGGDGVPDLQEQASEGAGERGSTQPRTRRNDKVSYEIGLRG